MGGLGEKKNKRGPRASGVRPANAASCNPLKGTCGGRFECLSGGIYPQPKTGGQQAGEESERGCHLRGLRSPGRHQRVSLGRGVEEIVILKDRHGQRSSSDNITPVPGQEKSLTGKKKKQRLEVHRKGTQEGSGKGWKELRKVHSREESQRYREKLLEDARNLGGVRVVGSPKGNPPILQRRKEFFKRRVPGGIQKRDYGEFES